VRSAVAIIRARFAAAPVDQRAGIQRALDGLSGLLQAKPRGWS
jgi:hypothetical protein